MKDEWLFHDIKYGDYIEIPEEAWDDDPDLLLKANDLACEKGWWRHDMTSDHIRWCALDILTSP